MSAIKYLRCLVSSWYAHVTHFFIGKRIIRHRPWGNSQLDGERSNPLSNYICIVAYVMFFTGTLHPVFGYQIFDTQIQ